MDDSLRDGGTHAVMPDSDLNRAKKHVSDAFALELDGEFTRKFSDRAILLTHQLLMMVGKEGNLSIALQISRNSSLLSDSQYCTWVADMCTHYGEVSKVVPSSFKVGVAHLSALVRGLPLLRRRLPEMTEDQECSLLMASSILLGAHHSSRNTYFYEDSSAGVITLRDTGIARAVISVSSSDRKRFMDVLTRMVLASGESPLRLAEIESALSGSHAASLGEGAL